MRRPTAILALVTATSCDLVLEINVGYLNHGSGTGGLGGTGGATFCMPGEKQECYTGPDGTKGQGICKPGEQTCNADGSAFGDCVGEQLPKVEDCATPVDEDCDGLAPTCEGLCLWSKAFGDEKTQAAQIVSFDPTGTVIVAGAFSGTLDFGGKPLTNDQGMGTFVAKLDASNGAHVWSKAFGGGVQAFGSVAVDTAGNVTAIGTFGGTVDFGGGPQDGGVSSTFVVQYGPDGAYHWSRMFSGGIQAPQSVAVGNDGAIFVIGSFLGSTNFGAGSVSANPGGADVFLVKLAGADGAYSWSETFGDGSDQSASRVILDPADGNIVVAGTFFGSMDFGSGALSNTPPGADVFIVKLAATDASPLWTRVFHGDADQFVRDMTSDHAGSLVVVGTFSGNSDLGGASTIKSAGGADIYVAKLGLSDGAQVWSKAFGQEGNQAVRGVAVDGMGNIVLAGPLSDDTDFGGGPLAASGLDVYVAKIDAAAGKHLWSKRFGDAADQAGAGVTADPAGNAYLTGYFSGSINFGCGKLTSAGDADVFVVALSP